MGTQILGVPDVKVPLNPAAEGGGWVSSRRQAHPVWVVLQFLMVVSLLEVLKKQPADWLLSGVAQVMTVGQSFHRQLQVKNDARRKWLKNLPETWELYFLSSLM